MVGIWHGPQAHYLAWGLYNGLVIALADLLEPAFKKLNTALHIPTESRGWHVFRIVRTFIIVNIGWYFDRNEFVQGCIYLRNTFTDFNLSALAANAPGAFAAVSGPAWGLVIISTLLVFAHSVLKEQGRDPYAEVCLLYTSFAIAQRIVAAANAAGIPNEDIYIDCLTPVSYTHLDVYKRQLCL